MSYARSTRRPARGGLARAAALLSLSLLGPTLAAQEAPQAKPKSVQVTGEVVDLWCYLDHGGHGAKHKACAVTCAEAGNPVGLVDSAGKVYLAMGAKKHQPGRELLIDHMAETVTVTGRLVPMGGADVLYVDSLVELNGYCPVAYKMAGKPVLGSPEFAVHHDGKLYFLANERAKQAFEKDPRSFLPVLGGNCVVCLAKSKERVPGDPRIFSVYEGRTYLFASAEQKQAFDAHPEEFTKAVKH